MARKKAASRLSAKNSKQELVETYNDLAEQLQTKRDIERKPEDRLAEKAVQESVAAADALSSDEVVRIASMLKGEVSRFTREIAERLEEEVSKYQQVKKAVAAKEQELQEIYEIQRTASTLAALIEAQHQKREDFEEEMATRQEELTREIQTLRGDWEKEKKQHDAEIKERDAAELKKREREKEEFRYSFGREQNLAREQFTDEKGKFEREIQTLREDTERQLSERQKLVDAAESELAALRARVDGFSKELDAGVAKSVKETTLRLTAESTAREELSRKELLGEKNVLAAKIEALQREVAEQAELNSRLSQQLEKAYAQVQDIAVKAIEGSANSKSLASLQQLLVDQTRRAAGEK